jgi:hypothetical protein
MNNIPKNLRNSASLSIYAYSLLPVTLKETTPGTHWIGGWIHPRSGLDDVEKILDLIGTRTTISRSSSL